jgi:hypothetical protein
MFSVLWTIVFLLTIVSYFQSHMSWCFLVSIGLSWEVIVRFVDIGGTVVHHCVNLSYCLLITHVMVEQCYPKYIQSVLLMVWFGFMVFNNTFNNISVLLVEETRVPGNNHWPATSHWQILSPNVVHLRPCPEWDSNSLHQRWKAQIA